MDKDLSLAQKEARTKTKLAGEKLASVGKLEEEIKDLKAAVAAAKGESSKWKKKCEDQAGAFAQEKQTLEEMVMQLTEKKNALESHIEEFCMEFSRKFAGKFFLGRMESMCRLVFLNHSLMDCFHPIRALL